MYELSNKCSTALNWREKLKDLCIFLNSDEKVSMEQSEMGNITRRAQGSAAKISVTFSVKDRDGCMHTADDDIIVCFGGATDNYLFLESCDIISLTHKRIIRHTLPTPVPPSKRWLHTVTSIGNKVLVLGGSGVQNHYHDFNQGSFILSVEANRDCSGYQIHKSSLLLEDISALPERRAGHTVTTYNVDGGTTKILLFGGQTSHHRYLNDVYTAECTNYTPSHILHNPPARVKITWKLVQCSGFYPRPRHCHSAVYLEKNRSILIFGGWAGPHEFLNDVHLLDVDVFSWSRVNTEGVPPCPRYQTNIFLVPPVQAKPEFATSECLWGCLPLCCM